MGSDSLSIAELAKYLQRDARDLEKLASQGRLPARKVAGDWRFSRTEVNDWLEREFSGLTDRQLEGVEAGVQGHVVDTVKLEVLVSDLMSPETTAVPLNARTAPGVLKELVEIANGNWQVYQPDKVLAAVKAREEMYPTALPGGVAIPHPRYPLAESLGDSVLAFGRTYSEIPFGGGRHQLTDLFFLVLCRDARTHLQVLARLSRMFQREGFLDRLRTCESPAEALRVISETEDEVLG
ncbi:MAG: PTS sugar transporter subunit IIA [Planctomycetota bacterium]